MLCILTRLSIVIISVLVYINKTTTTTLTVVY